MKTLNRLILVVLILSLNLVPQFAYAKTLEAGVIPQSAIDRHHQNIERILSVSGQDKVNADILYERYCAEMEAFFKEYPEYEQQLLQNYSKSNLLGNAKLATSTTRAFWHTVADAMFTLGMDSASFFMNHSLQDNPIDLGLLTGGTVAGKIKQVTAYTNWLKSNLSPFASNTTLLEQTKSGSMSFTKTQSTDLYYALKKVSMNVRMQRPNTSSPTVYFYSNVFDRYDFNEADYSIYEYFPDGTIVSLAYEAQSEGIIVPYNIIIQINGFYTKSTGVVTYYS